MEGLYLMSTMVVGVTVGVKHGGRGSVPRPFLGPLDTPRGDRGEG